MPRVVYEAQPIFPSRAEAGKLLAERLTQYSGDAVVMAVPRGGVPVAMEVADALKAPLDIVIPRKVAFPMDPGSGYGAVTEDGTKVLNERLVQQLGLTQEQVEEQVNAVREEIARRSAAYHKSLPSVSLEGKTAIIVDDGLASGYTMVAAVSSLKQRRAAKTIVAVPVATGTAYDLLKPRVDKLVCLVIARMYGVSVTSFYQERYDDTDDEIIAKLAEWQAERSKS